MVEKGGENPNYERILRALMLREVMAGKTEIDGNALAEEATRILTEGGTVKIITQPETNTKSSSNTNL